MGEPQLPSVTMWYWEAVIFLILSSPSIASLLQREKGGRRESILLGTAAAWSQGANLLALLGRSQPALGREKIQTVFTHPSKHGPPYTGTREKWTLQMD